MRFQNKIVVIATSGGSIGIECARMLQGEGAKVVFLVSDKSETAGMVESDTCKIVSVDRFYDEAEMEVKIRDALSEFGAAELVVTCLAAQPPAFVWNEIPEDEAHRYFDEIMTGVQTVLKYTVPAMIEQESGSVVVVESICGRTGVKGENVMSAAAHAGLGGLIRNMATVFGKHRITVNGVAVGPIKGEYAEPAVEKNAGPVLGVKGTGADVANAVADPAVFWNTGEIIDLNGGRFAI